MRPWGAVAFVALVLASFATAALVSHSKTPDLALEVERLQHRLTPGGNGPHRVARIAFHLHDGEPNATVELVGAGLDPARTLASAVSLPAGKTARYAWDGRTDAGSLAPRGLYSLRVILPSQGRDIIYPVRRIELIRGRG